MEKYVHFDVWYTFSTMLTQCWLDVDQYLRLKTYPKISLFKMSDPPPKSGFSGGGLRLWITFLFQEIWTYFQNKKCSKSITLSIHNIFKCARAHARAIFNIIFLGFRKNHHFFMFFREYIVMHTFVVLRDMSILAKQEMFKINQPFDQKHFQARAEACARYI